MTTNYRMVSSSQGWSSGVDLDDIYIRKDFFSDGSLWVWGSNIYGQEGIAGNTNARSSPGQTVAGGTNWRKVSAGGYGTAGIKTDGTLWLWGRNSYGGLGDNTIVSKSSPVQITSGGTNWIAVALNRHTSAGIKTDGTLWTWGRNNAGQLGDNTITHKSSPIQTVAGGTNWVAVAVGYTHLVAIKSDGTLWNWGTGGGGVMGDNTTISKSSPIQTITGGTTWKDVSAGGTMTMALKTDGTLWGWGVNNYGQIGNNGNANRSSPVQEVTSSTWLAVSTGGYHTGGVKTNGTLWAWGGNTYGQLGDNSRTHRSSPVQNVAGGANWRAVAAGKSMSDRGHIIAVKTDSTLWGWGYNLVGQVGDNTRTHRSSPIQSVATGSVWRTCVAGDVHSSAIKY